MKNPQLSTVVSSLTNVVTLVNAAEPAWWRCNPPMSPSSPGRRYKGRTMNWPSEKDDGQMFYFNQDAVEENNVIDLKLVSEDNDMDLSGGELDIDTPVLKKRCRTDFAKESDSSEEALSAENTRRRLSKDDGSVKEDKQPPIHLKKIPRPLEDSQGTSQATIPYEIENFPTESVFANTPMALNQSCTIPDCPNVSPIPMVDSQHTEAVPPTPCITINATSAITAKNRIEDEKKDSNMEEDQDVIRKMNSESQLTTELDVEIGEKLSVSFSGQKVTPPFVATRERNNGKTLVDRQCNEKSVMPTENLESAKRETKSKAVVTSTSSDAIIDNEVPLIFLLPSHSTLNAADNRIIHKNLKKKRFQLLQSDNDAKLGLNFNFNFDCKSDTAAFVSALYEKSKGALSVPAELHYAVCFNAEYQTCDGFIIPRSFRYLLAVACGLTIVDFSFLRKASSISSRKKTVPDYLYAPGCAKSVEVPPKKVNRSRGRKEEEVEDSYFVAGDVESVELMGPKRSRQQLLERMAKCTSCSYDNGLLNEYSIFLVGEFDKVPLSKRQKRKKLAPANADANDFDLYTKGRVKILLKLCGALIMNDVHGNYDCLESTGRTIVTLTRNKPTAKDMKLAKSSLKEAGISDDKIQNAAVVELKWLQDSIAEFKVKDLDGYRS